MNRIEEIAQNLEIVRANIAAVATSPVTLIAVTKTFPVSDVQLLKELGIQEFGENRDAEGAEKSAQVAGNWHFQGQIQSNKFLGLSDSFAG
jgi:uncharacterized pyridoxal phosphate-containing UPF0001 family protein